MQNGLLTVFCRHTSASLLIQENADPTVRGDIKAYFDRLAPEDGPYDHNDEGSDDMHAHLKTLLTQVQLCIPVAGPWGTSPILSLIEGPQPLTTGNMAEDIEGGVHFYSASDDSKEGGLSKPRSKDIVADPGSMSDSAIYRSFE